MTQLQETQDDLESEKDGRLKAEKNRRQTNDVGCSQSSFVCLNLLLFSG